jgi:hypothetical protein
MVVLVIEHAEHVHLGVGTPIGVSTDRRCAPSRRSGRTRNRPPATSANPVVEHLLEIGKVTLATCAGTILAAILMRIL